jgi:hypothetical protein
MTKRSTVGKEERRRQPGGAATPQADQADVPATPPLKPRRKLFVGLLLGFAAWIGALLLLYFQTVYPIRHPGQGAATTARS